MKPPLALPALACALTLAITQAGLAQGTANGPNTNHNVDAGGTVVIGDPNPFPIDLDPNGPPWIKSIFDPNGVIDPANGGNIFLTEDILNSGTEPWFDWHEHILPQFGVIPGIWVQASATVNNVPVGGVVLGLGTPNLWMEQFVNPVLPGDVLEIRKVIDVPFGSTDPALPLLVIEEFPTPEPATAMLVGIGGLLMLKRRRAVN